MCRSILMLLLVFECSGSLLASQDEEIRRSFFDGVAKSGKVVSRLKARWRVANKSGGITVSHDSGIVTEKSFGNQTAFDYGGAIAGQNGLRKGISQKGVETIQAMNDVYAFKLNRIPSGKNWTIEFVEPLGANPIGDKNLSDLKASTRSNVLGTWYAFVKPLDELARSPYFDIKSAEKTRDKNGLETVRIGFDNLDDNPDNRVSRVSDAWLVCVPDQGWALKEYGGTTWNGGRFQIAIEWGEFVDGFPLAKRVLTKSIRDDNPPNTEYRAVDEITEVGTDVPEAEFYLSHYGFPEPVFDNSWLSAWQKYLLAGIVCIAVAYFAQRRRAAA